MQFGVCGDAGIAACARRAGYDYAEWAVAHLLQPREDELSDPDTDLPAALTVMRELTDAAAGM